MSGTLRQQVLQAFRKLHKTRKTVFKNDIVALSEARKRINEEYKKSRHVTDPNAIEEMIRYSKDVERELRTTVIQAKEIKPGVYEAKITTDTVKLDNIPFNSCGSKQKN